MRSKLGGKGAVTATAHKLARIIYTMLLNKTEFNSEIIEGNQKKYVKDKILRLEKQIAKLKAA
jgi:hypothetical protein